MKRLIYAICVLVLLFLCSCTHESTTEYEDEIAYYEALCDLYGYNTYEMIYYPEKWCNYIPENDAIYHNDWLCPEFNNNGEYITTSSLINYKSISPCKTCQGTDIYYLDVDGKIFHESKTHLDLGTDDYISPHINYRFVSKNRALENGFTACNSCVSN